MLEGLTAALPALLDPLLLGMIVVGVAIGMTGGALPGISPSITIALMLPVAFTLDPLSSLVALGGIYMAAEYGGSISAILINTPGTAAAVCTAFDGHPMARQGRAQEALHAAILASSVGGLFGVLVLIAFTPTLAELSLKFQSPEMFWLAIAGQIDQPVRGGGVISGREGQDRRAGEQDEQHNTGDGAHLDRS